MWFQSLMSNVKFAEIYLDHASKEDIYMKLLTAI